MHFCLPSIQSGTGYRENVAGTTHEAAASLCLQPYDCKTRHFDTSRPNGLAFNITRAGNVVGRWARGSEISYFVSNTGLLQAQAEAIRTAISIAASDWALSGLGITFVEAKKEETATLLVVYDRFLDANTFANAFFPGDSRRIIDVGPRLLRSSKHMSNVLTHELGHVLGLRHELWDSSLLKERNNLVHWPSTTRDLDSIMNNFNACNLPLLVLSEQDRRIVREFYSLPAGNQGDFIIEDYIPTPISSGIQGVVATSGTISFVSGMQCHL